MSTREIALRCAAKVHDAFPHLLAGHKSGTVGDCEALGIKRHRDSLALLQQLDRCKDDAARRLITGQSR